jgi:hypothetical protein
MNIVTAIGTRFGASSAGRRSTQSPFLLATYAALAIAVTFGVTLGTSDTASARSCRFGGLGAGCINSHGAIGFNKHGVVVVGRNGNVYAYRRGSSCYWHNNKRVCS